MKILVIEDDASIRGSLVRILSLEGHEASSAADGTSGLEQAVTTLPDLVFSDVMMPGLDGYEVCRRIKAREETRHIPVIFISGQENIEARLAGYDAGGEDFVVKPFKIEEILRKVAVAARIASETRALLSARDEAQRSADETAGILGDMEVVFAFMRAAFASSTPGQLATALLAALRQYHLHGAVQLRLPDGVHTRSTQGEDIPLEASILGHLSLQGRVFDFHERSVFNCGGVTLLVHDMPTEKIRRILLGEYITLLAEGAESRRKTMELETAERRAKARLEQAHAAAQAGLAALGNSQRACNDEGAAALAAASEELARVFCGCGLADSQETAIMEVVETQIGRLAALFDLHRAATGELERIAGLLAAQDTQD